MTEQKEPLQAKEAVKDTPELNEAVTPENEAGFEGATGVDEATEASAAEVGVAEEDDESEADESPEAALAAERDQLQDRLLRLNAEFDNYKKRMIRENSERLRYSSFELLAGLLPTLDNLERAIAHAKKEELGSGLVYVSLLWMRIKGVSILKVNWAKEQSLRSPFLNQGF